MIELEREAPEGEAPPAPSRSRRVGPALAAAMALPLLLSARAAVGSPVEAVVETLRGIAGGTGIVPMIAYALASGLLVVFCFPGSVLMTAAGAAFGLSRGFVAAQLGASLGAALAFGASRYVARRPVERWMESKPAFAAVDRAVGSEGWKIVLLTRCCPIFPYVFQNYAYGLTRVSFGHYALGTFLGLVPTTLIFAYLGSLGATGVSVLAGRTSGLALAFRAVGLAATVVLGVFVTRVSRRALRKAGV